MVRNFDKREESGTIEEYKKRIPFYSISSADLKCLCVNFLTYRKCKHLCYVEVAMQLKNVINYNLIIFRSLKYIILIE